MTGEPPGQSYELVVRGEIGERLAPAFQGMRLERSRGFTVLTGRVLDQAHLHGLIERLQELGIELVSINPLDGRPDLPPRDLRKDAP
jgi:hypothetical protein